MERIPVYFVPGMAASPLIFENIRLPEDKFEVHVLEWMIPLVGESMHDYVQRWAAEVKHENPVLVGVSLGGLIVQEMCRIIKARKVIIISSVKSNTEFPRRMQFAKVTRLYRFFPTRMMMHVDRLNRFFPGNSFVKKRLNMYEKYLSVRDNKYLDWAFKNVIEWDRAEPDTDVVHIHGTADMVFPAKYIKNYIAVKGGTHIMIINRYAWMNEHLPKIILGEE